MFTKEELKGLKELLEWTEDEVGLNDIEVVVLNKINEELKDK